MSKREADEMAALMSRLSAQETVVVRKVLRATRIRTATLLEHGDGLVEACRAYLDAVGADNQRVLDNPRGFFVNELKSAQARHDAEEQRIEIKQERERIARARANARVVAAPDVATDFWDRFR